MHNPFRSDLFCERPHEFGYLCSAAINGLNVILSGSRGQGRTCLITKVLEEVEDQVTGIYIPCRALSLLNETIESALSISMVNGILDAYPESEEILREKLLRFDPIILLSNGRQKFEFGSPSKMKLSEIFEIWNWTQSNHDMTGLIVFDDFHLIAEEKIENQLRALIQQNSDCSHMFIINRGKGFERWFMNSERAFFRSGSQLTLESIPEKNWSEFIQEKFDSIGIKAATGTIAEILRLSELHTATVMQVCSVMAELGENRPIFPAEVLRAIRTVARRHEAYIWSIIEGLSKNQRSLLVALAHEEEPVKPYTKSFFSKHDLSSTSLQKSVPALRERELVIEYEAGTIGILDPVFRHSILRETGNRRTFFER